MLRWSRPRRAGVSGRCLSRKRAARMHGAALSILNSRYQQSLATSSAPAPLCSPGAPSWGPSVCTTISGGTNEWCTLWWNWLKACCSSGCPQICGPTGTSAPDGCWTKCRWGGTGVVNRSDGSARLDPANANSAIDATAVIKSRYRILVTPPDGCDPVIGPYTCRTAGTSMRPSWLLASRSARRVPVATRRARAARNVQPRGARRAYKTWLQSSATAYRRENPRFSLRRARTVPTPVPPSE